MDDTSTSHAPNAEPAIHAIDLFCGTGGLSLGLQQSGISVVAGIDIEQRCAYPYQHNLHATFIQASVTDLQAHDLTGLWPDTGVRLLAGCAPCQPFSSQRRGLEPSKDKNWPLLGQFARLVQETTPELVTMENVPRLARDPQFHAFVTTLETLGYHVASGVLYGPDFGLPQHRKRLVLLASRLGPVDMPTPTVTPEQYATVEQTIGHLPPLEAGGHDEHDPLHFARQLSPMNLARAKASRPGGTWRDWDPSLMLECHKRSSGQSFDSFYGRMRADEPSPTITTQPFNTGAGRFTHPTQDRALSLREAALLQGFPQDFVFTSPEEPIYLTPVGKLIGNAVPPVFGKAVGEHFNTHLQLVTQGSPT